MQEEILVIGPSIDTPGGVASVVNFQLHDPCLNERFGIRFIRSTGDRPSSDWGKLCFSNILFFFKTVRMLVLSIISYRIIVCHIHTSYGISFYKNLFFALLCKLFGKSVVLHIHGSQIASTLNTRCRLISTLNSLLISACDAIIVLNSEVFELVKKSNYSEKKIFLIPNVIINKPHHSEESDGLSALTNFKANGISIIMTVGVVGRRKGIFEIIRMASLAADNKERLVFFVVGGWADTQEKKKVLDEIEKLSLNDYIVFAGEVPHGEVLEYYRFADIYLLPSYHEGMPISILEAMAAGLPVISTPVGGIPELISDGVNGYLVPVGDAESTFLALIQLVKDTDLAREMGKRNLYEMGRRYGPKDFSNDLIRVYGSLGKDIR
ncbi:MAG: glycosyltransferase family 4 protein [Syntrophobacteraceae bacterium]